VIIRMIPNRGPDGAFQITEDALNGVPMRLSWIVTKPAKLKELSIVHYSHA
jgi:hypothetical protein